MNPEAQKATMRRIGWKLLPFLGLCYFVSWLDRVNIGMAALTMNKALGLSATAFGTGAGIFFIGYFLFEVPSNVILRKVGTRIWIARIMITWGLITMATSMITGAWSFYFVRLILGVAEAGFFPGMLYFITCWFPASYRGRVIGIFMASTSVSAIIGPIISGHLLDVNAWGLEGWQWLFVVEGAMAVIVGIACLRVLIDRPADARWLSPEERDWLQARLDAERETRETHGSSTLWSALSNPRVLALSVVYFGLVLGAYSFSFWGPQIIKGLGHTNIVVAYISGGISLVGGAAMILWSWHSDRTGERTWHLLVPIVISALGFLITGVSLDNPNVAVIGLCLGSAGIAAATPVFWTLPTAFLSAAGAAAGLAFINAIGNLAGYFGQTIIGVLKDATGSFEGALIMIAICVLIAGVLGFLLGHDRSLEPRQADEMLPDPRKVGGTIR